MTMHTQLESAIRSITWNAVNIKSIKFHLYDMNW